MIARNGVRSTLRARGRTVLFTLLILVLTLSLTLGLGLWAYCAQALRTLDENYTSIALIEYVGSQYPDRDVADEQARAARTAVEALDPGSLPGVELWEPERSALVGLSGYTRRAEPMPYADNTVLECFGFSPNYDERLVEAEETELEGLENYLVIRPDRGPQLADVKLDGVVYEELPVVYLARRDFYATLFYSYNEEQKMYVGEEVFVGADDSMLPERYVLAEGPWEYMNCVLVDRTAGVEADLSGGPVYWRSYGMEIDQEGNVTDADFTYLQRMETYVRSWSATANRVLYCRNKSKAFTVQVYALDYPDFQPQRGEKYLIHGTLDTSQSITTMNLAPFQGSDALPYALSGGEGGIFAEYAALYELANNYARVTVSDDIAALEPFQQGTLYLTQGRFPQAGEGGVCVLDGQAAEAMGLAVGDTVTARRLQSEDGNRFRLTDGGEERTYTVVGITNPGGDEYAGCLWVSGAEGDLAGGSYGYLLGRAVLDNAAARKAADALQAQAPEGVMVTLYDQGYAVAAQPLESMGTTAMAVTAASACGALAVLVLFAYLFVGRQRETVEILGCLGTPRGKIRLWLLSGGGLIAAVAAALGALLGGVSLKRVLEAALSSAQDLYAADLRYSDGALGLHQAAPGQGTLPWWPAPLAGLCVFLAAMVLCLFFLRAAQRRAVPKRGKLSVRVPKGGTSTLGRGPARFAALSAKRGGWRSAVVPAAAVTLALLLGLLASAAQGWQGQLDYLRENTKIMGQATSTTGRQLTKLSIPAESVRTLAGSGLVEDLAVSKSWNYWLPDGMPEGLVDSAFGRDFKSGWVAKQPRLVAANALEAAPDFLYGGMGDVLWLEGWDAGFLREEYPSLLSYYGYFYGRPNRYGHKTMEVYPCVVSQGFLDGQALALGEEFEVVISAPFEGWADVRVPLRAVGAYQDAAAQADICLPLSFWGPESWFTGPRLVPEGETPDIHFDSDGWAAYYSVFTNYETLRFTVRPDDLPALRDFLSGKRFSQVGVLTGNRTTLILRDQSYTETVRGLGRYISFSRLLFPVLFATVGLLGFVISWLMVSARRMEFAILRGLGASRGRVFCTFFAEQGGLCLLGCVLAGVVLTLLGAGAAGWAAVGLLLVCYLAGCALSVLAAGRAPLMALLSERE